MKEPAASGVIDYNVDEDDDFEFAAGLGAKDQPTEWQKPFPWDKTVAAANKVVFNNESFRECQREIINCTKSKRDAIALIPTGGGKSLTFQLAAVTDSGVTFVIMPLLSLIEDNLNFVLDLGIPAVSLSQTKGGERKMG